MLSKAKSKELAIFIYIVNEKSTSIEKIAASLQLPKRAIKDAIIKTNTSLNSLFSIEGLIISNYKGEISIAEDYRGEALSLFYQLKLHYLKQSIKFNYVLLLIKQFKVSKETLLRELYISESYLSRITKELNEYLLDKGILITCDEDGFFFSGREFLIRLFMFTTLMDAYQTIEWPFEEYSMEHFVESIPKRLLQNPQQHTLHIKHSFAILLMIIQIRSQNHAHFITKFDPQVMELFKLVNDTLDLDSFDEHNYLETADVEIIESEKQALSFFTVLYFSDFIDRQKKVDLGWTFFHTDNRMSIISRQLTQRFDQILSLALYADEIAIYNYYLTLFQILYFFLGNNYEKYLELFFPVPQFHLQIHKEKNQSLIKKIEGLVDEVVTDTWIKQTPSLEKLLVNFLLGLSKATIKPKVYVYTQMNKDFTAIYFIRRRLLNIFNNNNIIFTYNYQEADIIITDTMQENVMEKAIFYVGSVFDAGEWQKLLMIIQRIYFDKIVLLEDTM